MAPQVDDVFIPDDIWDTEALTDTTGLTFRMSGSDLLAFRRGSRRPMPAIRWQAMFAPSFAFNGEGTDAEVYPDSANPTLVTATLQTQDSFNWISHTSYDHLNLDHATAGETRPGAGAEPCDRH